MPSECENHLDIFGEYEDLLLFFDNNRVEQSVGKKRKMINQNILTFSKTVPVDNEDDIEECKEKWGTKRNAEIKDWEEDFEDEMEQFYYVFLTSGNPPNKWLEAVAEKYPEIEFNLVYKNESKDVNGEIVYRDGKLYHSTRNNYSDEIWGYIGEDLIEDLKTRVNKKTKNMEAAHIVELLKNKSSSIHASLRKYIQKYDDNSSVVVEKAFEELIKIFENDEYDSDDDPDYVEVQEMAA